MGKQLDKIKTKKSVFLFSDNEHKKYLLEAPNENYDLLGVHNYKGDYIGTLRINKKEYKEV